MSRSGNSVMIVGFCGILGAPLVWMGISTVEMRYAEKQHSSDGLETVCAAVEGTPVYLDPTGDRSDALPLPCGRNVHVFRRSGIWANVLYQKQDGALGTGWIARKKIAKCTDVLQKKCNEDSNQSPDSSTNSETTPAASNKK